MRAPRSPSILWLVLLGITACDLTTDGSGARVLTSSVTAPAPLVRTIAVTLDRPAEVTLEYWTNGGPRLRLRAPAAEQHELLLTRLRPGRRYDYEVVGLHYSGSFTTDPLPADLARVTLTSTGQPGVPLVMLHLYAPDGFRGYAILDGAGEVVWYWRTTDFPFGMARRENGNFVFMDKGRGLVEVAPNGQVVHELAQDLANRELHHDVIATPRNTLLFIAFDDRVVNGAKVRGEAIWEWTPESGVAEKRWTSWDFFPLAENIGPRFGQEWMHANALAIGPGANVLLSVHYWNQIISIAPDWQRVQWRLGGINATIPVASTAQFSGQHTPRELAEGRILLFDNGVERGADSRAIELVVDGNGARPVWEWRPPTPNFASAVGSARRLADGGTLVTFGMSAGLAGSTGPTEIYDVSSTGTQRWHLVVRNVQIMFRAEPMLTIAGEEIVP